MNEYYDEIKAAAPFSHIESDKDLEWLLKCTEGRIVTAEKDSDIWKDDGFIYVRLGKSDKALRLKQMRVEKVCGFKCDFHIKLVDFLGKLSDLV